MIHRRDKKVVSVFVRFHYATNGVDDMETI
jgi:hypothetical protein